MARLTGGGEAESSTGKTSGELVMTALDEPIPLLAGFMHGTKDPRKINGPNESRERVASQEAPPLDGKTPGASSMAVQDVCQATLSAADGHPAEYK
jgi:hypothetical protein